MMRLPSELETRLQRDAGVGHFDYLVLATLSMADGQRLRLSEIARFTGSSLTRLSNVITKFEQRGWVRREPDQRDRRATLGVLTDAGLEVVEQAAPYHVQHVRELVIDQLTADQLAGLGAAAHIILQAIDPTGLPPGLHP